MKRIIMGLLSGILFLTACGQTPSATQTAPIPVVEQATATPSSIPTSTQTSIPSATLTASITPLPTIPTFTPTFDASSIVTVTPAPKAECPKEDSSVKLDFDVEKQATDVIQNILDYLNKGGSIKSILSGLSEDYFPKQIRFEDLTGDGVSEFAYIHYNDPISGGFYIFSA